MQHKTKFNDRTSKDYLLNKIKSILCEILNLENVDDNGS